MKKLLKEIAVLEALEVRSEVQEEKLERLYNELDAIDSKKYRK